MAAYDVTTFTAEGDYDTVLAAIETKLETVTDTKTIRYNRIIEMPNRNHAGILIYDT